MNCFDVYLYQLLTYLLYIGQTHEPEEGDKICCLDPQWVDLLLDGKKTMEVFNCKNNDLSEGQRIYLSKKRTKQIQGCVTYVRQTRLTTLNWKKNRHLHRVPGGLYYTGKTSNGKTRENWGYYVKDPCTFPTSIPYKHMNGTQKRKIYHKIK